jgi:hypothetical protein
MSCDLVEVAESVRRECGGDAGEDWRHVECIARRVAERCEIDAWPHAVFLVVEEIMWRLRGRLPGGVRRVSKCNNVEVNDRHSQYGPVKLVLCDERYTGIAMGDRAVVVLSSGAVDRSYAFLYWGPVPRLRGDAIEIDGVVISRHEELWSRANEGKWIIRSSRHTYWVYKILKELAAPA